MHIIAKLFPHFFNKEPLREISNPDLLKAIAHLRKLPNPKLAMEAALILLNEKFESKHFESVFYLYKAKDIDPNRLWKRRGFMHCTQQNYLFRILLVESGQLKDEQISLGYSLIWHVSPHQFLKVRLKNRVIAVDPWNYGLGATLGKYASGFGMKTLNKKVN